MLTVDIYEAKIWLLSLLEQVQAGEDVIIAKAGRPIARLIRFTPPGVMRNQIRIADDFDEPIDSVFDCFGRGSLKSGCRSILTFCSEWQAYSPRLPADLFKGTFINSRKR